MSIMEKIIQSNDNNDKEDGTTIILENPDNGIDDPLLSKSKQKERKESIRLEWKDIQVTAKGPKPTLCAQIRMRNRNTDDVEANPETIHILKGLSGGAEPGTLVAIMGASGAGKTTLLNVLARHAHQGVKVKGKVLVNNKSISSKMKSVSAYVQQEDIFIGTLTVKEHLRFQAMLRMDSSYTTEEKNERVDDVITQLGLTKCQDNLIGVHGRIGGISGGEKKRLSFASELIINPKLLFVDEPTSGLDSFMAESSVMALQTMARQGRTVLVTIHQPSSSVFHLFDRLVLLSEGNIAFQGRREDAGHFFAECGFPIPLNYNPADHYIEILAIVPGEEEECKQRCKKILDAFAVHNGTSETVDHQSDEWDTDVFPEVKYQQSFYTQLSTLLGRSLKQFKRDPLVSRIRVVQAVFVSIIVGLIFLKQHNDEVGVCNINGVIFFQMVTLSFSNAVAVVTLFPEELPIFLKENRLSMYRTDAYFIARQLGELPWYLLSTSIQTTIIYWMTGLRVEFVRFAIFFAIAHMTTQSALSYGMIISAIAPTATAATALSGPLIIPIMLFGGFFIKDQSIPVYFICLKVFSWIKYAFELAQVNQWHDFGNIGCSINHTSKCVLDGEAVLQTNNYRPENFYLNLGALLGLMVGLRFIAFGIVLMKTYRNR